MEMQYNKNAMQIKTSGQLNNDNRKSGTIKQRNI